MKKMFILFMFTLLILGVVGCSEKITSLATPENFKITDGVISFDNVPNAEKYRILITSKEDESTMKRFVKSGDDLNDLNIEEGSYMISIQAISDTLGLESEYTTGLDYKQIDLYAVKSLEADQLISGDYVKWMGRTSYDEKTKQNTMYYSASGFEVKVKKTEEDLTLSAVITGTNTASDSKNPYIVLVKDEDFENTITIALRQAETVVNFTGENGFNVNDNEVHTFALYKRSESIDSHIALKKLETSGKFIEGVTYKNRKIEMIAASSSTGYGNLGTSSQTKSTANSDALNAFAFLTARNVGAEINIVSASGWGIYASRWTSPNTICMKDRYKYVDVFSTEVWDTTKYVPDVIITNFGTNDLSYINVADTQKEKDERIQNFINYYVEFLCDLHTTYPNAQIIILYGLMVETGIYQYHQNIFDEAKKSIPNLDMIQIIGDQRGCSSHPSLQSHKTISDKLTEEVKKLMNW